jgi:hypothetical protein
MSAEEKIGFGDVDEGKVEIDGEEVSGSLQESDPPKLEGRDLCDKVSAFFFGDDELAATFQQFVAERASVVDLDSDEYKLEYTEIYNEYKTLFEGKLESFIIGLGSTVEEFFEALQQQGEEDGGSMFGQLLLAISGFDVFMTMMREAAESNSKK